MDFTKYNFLRGLWLKIHFDNKKRYGFVEKIYNIGAYVLIKLPKQQEIF